MSSELQTPELGYDGRGVSREAETALTFTSENHRQVPGRPVTIAADSDVLSAVSLALGVILW